MADKKKTLLVSGYLEDVSIQAFEDYGRELSELIGNQSGIYALYRGGVLYYVGLASNLNKRLRKHRRDKHRGKWDRFSAYVAKQGRHIRELEALCLRIMRPAGNLQIGKFSRAKNHAADLRQLLDESAREIKARVMEGEEAELRQLLKESARSHRTQILGASSSKKKSKTRAKKSARARSKRKPARASASSRSSNKREVLANFCRRNRELWGHANGKDYSATLLPSGEIEFRGHVYATPSGAGRAARGRKVNGWAFWHYSVGKGYWMRLENLR